LQIAPGSEEVIAKHDEHRLMLVSQRKECLIYYKLRIRSLLCL
jgi:hypothetical protein